MPPVFKPAKAMEISIDVEVLKKSKLSPDEFVLLKLLSEGDYAILSTLEIEVAMIRSLENRQWLKILGDRLPEDLEIRQSFLNLMAIPREKVKDWIEDWVELFPRGVKSGNHYVRSHKTDCQSKMEKFIKRYNYDQVTIMKATENYLERFRTRNWKYVMMASNFIHHRDKGSMLASECANIGEESELPSFAEFGTNEL